MCDYQQARCGRNRCRYKKKYVILWSKCQIIRDRTAPDKSQEQRFSTFLTGWEFNRRLALTWFHNSYLEEYNKMKPVTQVTVLFLLVHLSHCLYSQESHYLYIVFWNFGWLGTTYYFLIEKQTQWLGLQTLLRLIVMTNYMYSSCQKQYIFFLSYLLQTWCTMRDYNSGVELQALPCRSL